MPINVLHCACVARCGMVINACASRNWFCCAYVYPQRAKHAINDNSHSLLWKTIKAHWGIACTEN